MFSTFLNPSAEQVAAAIGVKLKQHRLAKNITQNAMASRASVSPSTLKRIEAHGLGSLRDAMAIAIELGIVHEILEAIPRAPLQSLADLDSNGRRINRVRSRAARRSA